MPKTIRLNAKNNFIIKIANKRELLKVVSNHSSGIEFKDSMNLCKDYTKEIFSFLVNSTTSPSDNSLRFRKKNDC